MKYAVIEENFIQEDLKGWKELAAQKADAELVKKKSKGGWIGSSAAWFLLWKQNYFTTLVIK